VDVSVKVLAQKISQAAYLYIHIYSYIFIFIYLIARQGKFFLLQNVWSLIFVVLCHRPDDGFLQPKQVPQLRIEIVRVGCDCTVDRCKM
jgi:hypothetical protein